MSTAPLTYRRRFIFSAQTGESQLPCFTSNRRIFSGQPNSTAALDGTRLVYSQLDLQGIDAH
jgi:hypothetical protein